MNKQRILPIYRVHCKNKPGKVLEQHYHISRYKIYNIKNVHIKLYRYSFTVPNIIYTWTVFS